MRKHSRVIFLLAEEQLVFGRSSPKWWRRETILGASCRKPFARIARCKDRAQKSGTPLACKPVGRVSVS